ncbi:MAG: hypothetical protein AAF587_20625 [Bacteroidota bacterium]
MVRKTSPTGYWTFMCNPRIWEIDRFLAAGMSEDTYRIIPYQQSWFEKGQLAVIRVGIDKRTRMERNGRPKLEAGIYAIVEIRSKPRLQLATKPEFYLQASPKVLQPILRVKIRLYRNLLRCPILLSDLQSDPLIQEDSYLLKGFQGASMPLHPLSFQRILELRDTAS